MNPEDSYPVDMASLLTVLGDRVSHAVLRSLEGTGLRHGHGYLVQRLLAGPATATEMAVELGVSQQAVSKVLKELVSLGHVEPALGATDRRRRPVALSATGLQAVRSARAARRDIDTQIRRALGDDGFDATLEALATVVETFGLTQQVRRRAVPPPGKDFG